MQHEKEIIAFQTHKGVNGAHRQQGHVHLKKSIMGHGRNIFLSIRPALLRLVSDHSGFRIINGSTATTS
jgi:hypothetical protein